MPYISLDNLTQYNGRLRDYVDASFDKLDGANWRKTSAGQSVSCFPIPESPLEPEVAFKFTETPPVSGDKGPDNPSTITGLESVSCHVSGAEGEDDAEYSISLGGTYYGGTVNFATGVLEVTYSGQQIDAFTSIDSSLIQENTVCLSSSISFRHLGNTGHDGLQYATNRFISQAYNNDVEHVRQTGGVAIGASGLNFYINKARLDLSNAADPSNPTGAEWIAAGNVWLANNPILYVGKLFTPTIVPLTPVLVRSLPTLSHYVPRQNNVYTSHESVQVGYAKSASKTSQDLANAIVALGGNV